MESELASHLIELARRFGKSKGLKETTVGRFCAQDGRFFARIRDGNTFTAKKYDEVVAWFSANWPSDAKWPEYVTRPAPQETAA